MRTITIKHKNFLKDNRSKIKIAGAVLITLLTLFSCRSTDVEGSLTPAGQAAVSVSIKDIIFEGTESIANKASAGKNTIAAPPVQQNTVAFNDDFYMVAELTQEVSSAASTPAKASSTSYKAAADTTILKPTTQYKIVVYDQNGVYVTEKNYTKATEGPANAFMLEGGKTYTFIVYSINNTTVPAVIFSNPANKTLATSSVNITGTQDFMYYRKDMTVSGGTTTNYLEVVLKHKLSQITTTIDATQTGYNVTAVTSHFTRHNSTATINLADANIARTGTVGNSAVTFTSPNALIVTSAPTIINANANSTTSYTIDNITIGPLTQSNITPFTNLNITPGVKYNMKLTIIPQDIYLTHQGLPAARINGQIWMRHNVGADYTRDPDQSPVISNLHGNYYQWGRITSVGSRTSTSVSNWNASNNPAVTSWNLQNGTSNRPEKGPADPCPTGFRVPGNGEVQALLNNTVHTNTTNTWTANNTEYRSAKILTSKRNRAVKVVLPAQGWYSAAGNNPPYTALGLALRGSNGFYWTAYRSGNANTELSISSSNISLANRPANLSNFVISHNIRCIAE
ncbi:fimbrillin family protein [Sphingobacterium sp. KU25419]|nr:fimbrillin family protein [Sphingobacterium sp. KU25419]